MLEKHVSFEADIDGRWMSVKYGTYLGSIGTRSGSTLFAEQDWPSIGSEAFGAGPH